VTDAELQVIVDETKTIDGDIEWKEDEDHSPAVEFRIDLDSPSGWPLVLCGSYNGLARTLTYAIIHRAAGRIYALDLGKDHKNPDGRLVGEKHKHRWTEQFRDKSAYRPEDITAAVEHPVEVWTQFCAEAKINHNGRLKAPPPVQGIL
jgi:hypothetical protein